MYLKYLQIVNYKNLKNVRFEFAKGTNTIVGENDAGKSNAMTALRILLDSNYYYNTKRLKESDFSHTLGDWRGHWIIISAFFDELTRVDEHAEICNEMKISEERENVEFLKSYIRLKDTDFGTVTLFIRPQRSIRFQLSKAKSLQEINEIKRKITLDNYEFFYTCRSQADFTNPENYKTIVGDFEKCEFPNPENDDALILGTRTDILRIWQHISIAYIDALRDAAAELRKPRNSISRVFEILRKDISDVDLSSIRDKIKELNNALINIREISNLGDEINNKLHDMVGLVYSPDIRVQSKMQEDIDSLARYLTAKPRDDDNIDLLGLGHLNILYMALKLIEFDVNKNHEILNIMIIEEPEAHVHVHIQKTLFNNLKKSNNYTQIIMTTHSAHISESSNIRSMNVLKCNKQETRVMQPTKNLDDFGKNKLNLHGLTLSSNISRYLDVKRSILLFG